MATLLEGRDRTLQGRYMALPTLQFIIGEAYQHFYHSNT